MNKIGIHIRLLVAAMLLISAATFSLGGIGINITSKFMHKRFKDRILFLAKYLALNSEVGVLIGDKAGLKSLALNLLGEEDVARVEIIDNHDNKLVDLKRDVRGATNEVETPIIFKKTNDENLIFQPVYSTPFGKYKMPYTEFIGKVKIHYSTHGIDELMVEITRKFIIFSCGLVIVSGFVFFFISHSIVSDVTRLATVVRQVGRGDLELRAEPGKIPETKELAIAFNNMMDSLQKHQETLDRVNKEIIKQTSLAEIGKFSMMIAHEFKNPLAIIKSSIDVLIKDLNLSRDNVIISYIEDEVYRLNRLIEDFLLFAKPVKPTFRPVDLNQMLSDIILKTEIQNKNLPIQIHTDITNETSIAEADRDLLTRSINNIISNACDANGNSGDIHVCSTVRDTFWIVEVIDQGAGIEDDVMTQIFEPFYTTKSKGSGLGLAFVKQVVTGHNGFISATNAKNGGAKFTLSIPLVEPGEEYKISERIGLGNGTYSNC